MIEVGVSGECESIVYLVETYNCGKTESGSNLR